MADFDAAPGGAFALEALEVGALVYVAGRAYRLDHARRFMRAAEADFPAEWDGPNGPPAEVGLADGGPIPGDWRDWRNYRDAQAADAADPDPDYDDEAFEEGFDAAGDDACDNWPDDDDEGGDDPDVLEEPGEPGDRRGHASRPVRADQTEALTQARQRVLGLIAARPDGAPAAAPDAALSTASDGEAAVGDAHSVEDRPWASVLDLEPWTPARAPSAAAEGGHLAFTPAKKVRFIEVLAETGNVRHACARAGISRHTAYKARRREAVLSQAWEAALALAAEHVDAVVAERALDGVEEPVFWKGELVGTRRRYDNRLLLAHLARLEARAAQRPVALAAGRFDELLAQLGGQRVDPALLRHRPTFMEDGLPAYWRDHVPGLAIPRKEWCDHAQRYAEETAAMLQTGDADYDWGDEEWEACTGGVSAAALAEARERWDAHHDATWDYVDALETAWCGAAVARSEGEKVSGGEVSGGEAPVGEKGAAAAAAQADDPAVGSTSMAGACSGARPKTVALNCVTPVTPLLDGAVEPLSAPESAPPPRGGSGYYPVSPIFRGARAGTPDFGSAVTEFTAQGVFEYDALLLRDRGLLARGAGQAL